MSTYDETKLGSDPTTSYWLRDALTATAKRDPVDVYNDVQVLFEVAKSRLTKTLQDSHEQDGRS